MPNFLLVYRSQPYTAADVSPAQMEESMKRWTAWITEGFTNGWMVDPGDALLPDGRKVDVNRAVTDGPFVEAKEVVGGYSVVTAPTYEQAVEYAKKCPHIDDGGHIEVRQTAGLSPPKG